MKIVRVRHLFYPDMPRDYFYELSMHQAKRDNEVHVITWNKKRTKSEFVSDGFVIHRLNGLNFGLPWAFQDYPYLPTLSSTLKQINSDIIHGESHLFLPSLQALNFAKKFRCPYVVTVHGVYASRGFIVNCSQKTYLRSVSGVFNKADKIICLTTDDALELGKYGFLSEKIRIVPNGVDTERFKPSNVREDNLIVWVGRFVPEKGVEFLVEAARKLRDQNVAVKVLLIGYGPLKKKLEVLAYNYGLLGRTVFFSESLNRDQIANILGKATFFGGCVFRGSDCCFRYSRY
jgi:glycosyltransferase involved in cell wall biosynthesis